MTLSEILRTIETALTTAAPLAAGINPIAGFVVGTLAAGTGLAADLAGAGHDPQAAITRLRDRLPLTSAVEDAWSAELSQKGA